MLKDIKDKIIYALPAILLSTLLVVIIIYAWTEPTQPPPQGNVPAPLNVGPIGQAKAGGLILNTGGAATGLIVQSGNVGIGTTGPGAGLDINRGATNDLALRVISSGAGWGSGMMFTNTAAGGRTYGIYSGSDGNWHFADETAGVDRVLINSAGNIGIGTTAPAARLHVVGGSGSLQLTNGDSGATAGSWVSDTLRNFAGAWPDMTWYRALYAGDATGGYAWDEIYGVNRYSIYLGGERLTVTSGGNVGIGTTAPTQKLDVVGYVKGRSGLCIGDDCRTSWPIGGGPGSDLTVRRLYLSNRSGGATWLAIGDEFSDDWLRINRDQNFGGIALYKPVAIGTGGLSVGDWSRQGTGNIHYTGQLTKLDVANNFTAAVRAADFLLGYSGRRGSPGRALVDLGGSLALNYAGDWGRTEIHGGTTYISGNVGIGTTAPGYKLDVSGDIRATGWLRTDGSQGWYSQTYGGGWHMTDTTWIRAYNNKNVWVDQTLGANAGLTIGYGGTSAPSGGAIIAGNVGIGTTGPGYKLDVRGSIRATETSYIPMSCRAITAEDIDPQPTCGGNEWQLAAWCSGNCDVDDARVTICCSR